MGVGSIAQRRDAECRCCDELIILFRISLRNPVDVGRGGERCFVFFCRCTSACFFLGAERGGGGQAVLGGCLGSCRGIDVDTCRDQHARTAFCPFILSGRL